MDKLTHAGAMAKLGAAYSRTIEPDQLAVFYDALGRYPSAAVERAVQMWIETQERFPTPTKLIEVVQAVLRQRASDRSDTHGLPEEAEQPQLDGTSLKTQRMAGLKQAREALAAARAQNPTPEPGDEE